MNGYNQFNRIKIGVIEALIITNIIFFIPYLLYIIYHPIQAPLYYSTILLNLNVNLSEPFLNFIDGGFWQIFTAMFRHGFVYDNRIDFSNNFFHIFFNMYALYIFGKPLEYRWGKMKFLSFYIITGILANLASALILILFDKPTTLLGASGAVYAVLLAFGSYYTDSKILLFFFIPLKTKWLILGLAVLELILEITKLQPGVSHITHLFGFLFAFLYLLVFFRINAIQKMFFPKNDDFTVY